MKKFALALLSLSLMASSASAAVTDVKVEKDFSNNLITIIGKANPNESVAFQILPDGISLSSFAASSTKENDIAFVYEEQADEKGDFSVTAKLKASGKYDIFFAAEDAQKEAASIDDIPFYTFADYDTMVSEINGVITNKSAFISTAKAGTNPEVLGFDDAINEVVNIDDTLSFVFDELRGTALDSGRFVENAYLYKNSAVIIALNNAKITAAYEYIKNIIEEDSTLKKYWEQYITGEEQEKYLFSKITGKSITSIADLKTKIKEGLILTATRFPNGYMSLQPLYSDYKNIIGISSVSSANSVYSSVGAKDFASITDLKNAYNNAVSAIAKTVSGGGGGGGGGGGLSLSVGGGQTVTSDGQTVIPGSSFEADIIDTSLSSENSQTPLGLKFQDLYTYEWAYPSISILHEKGIVSGLSEIQFAPGRKVKREEFIKMIVCAMGLEMNAGDRFSDVDASAWYAPYVYAAYNNNLVNGISENEFGVSLDILRQDMAVMIYNAIKQKGYIPSGAELAFDDKDSISDYANEAVAELSALGIINGMGDGRFAPREKATRAQSAVIIERALKYLGQ